MHFCLTVYTSPLRHVQAVTETESLAAMNLFSVLCICLNSLTSGDIHFLRVKSMFIQPLTRTMNDEITQYITFQ